MSIKAKLGEIEFELETESDLRVFLAAAKGGTVSTLAPALAPDTPVQKFRKFLKRIDARSKQKKAVFALADSPQGLTDVQLRQAIEVVNNNELGGMVAGMQKSAKYCGLKLEQVLSKTRLTGAKPARFLYRVTPDIRDLIHSKPIGRS